jgi:fatty acid desaturase
MLYLTHRSLSAHCTATANQQVYHSTYQAYVSSQRSGYPGAILMQDPISMLYLNSGITLIGIAGPEHTQAHTRKDLPTMSLAINKNFFLLVILAFLTLLVVSFIVIAMVAHIDLYHLATSFTTLPDVMNGSH